MNSWAGRTTRRASGEVASVASIELPTDDELLAGLSEQQRGWIDLGHGLKRRARRQTGRVDLDLEAPAVVGEQHAVGHVHQHRPFLHRFEHFAGQQLGRFGTRD